MCAKFHNDIIGLIDAVRNSFSQAREVYLYGSCYKFHEILAKAFPHLSVVPYYNVDHVISKIGKRFYDITGEVTDVENFQDLREEPNSLEFYQGPNKFDFKDPSRIHTWLNLDPSLKSDINPILTFHRYTSDLRLRVERRGYPFVDVQCQRVREGNTVKLWALHGKEEWVNAEVKARHYCLYLDTGLSWLWLTDVSMENKLTVVT